MKNISNIITEEINKTIINNCQKRIIKLLNDLNKINFSSCGQEIIEYAQDLNNIGWNVVECIKNGNIDGKSEKSGIVGKYKSSYFNPYGFSNLISKYGFKIPNEGITNNVIRNSINTYNKTQKIWGNKSSQQGKNINNNNIKLLEGNLKQIMATYWPQIFTKYANIVGRYKPILQKYPTLTMLTQSLEQLYDSIK